MPRQRSTLASTIPSSGLAPPLGGEADSAPARERKLRRAEAHVAWMRDAVAAFVWLTVPWLLQRPELATPAFVSLILVGTAHTILSHQAYRRGWGGLERRAFVTSMGDAGVVLALIAVSGGAASPLTPLLYVSMAAFAYRYELAYGLAFGAFYGLGYVVTLFAVGAMGPAVDLVLRVGMLVATGMLASLSSKSFLEAEVERSRVQHAFEDVLETVPGDVALVRREAAFDESLPGEEQIPRTEAVEAALADWVPPAAIERNREALARVFATGEPVEYEFSTPEEGATAVYRTLVGPLGEGEDVSAAVVITTDVTDRKRAQQRLRDHARALRQSNRALARYASLTAHDLREPLRDIVRYLQRIDQRDLDLDVETREELAFVIDRARRLDSLVGALHRFAEVDERPLATERVDLEDALQAALHRLDLSQPPEMIVESGELATITADRHAIVAVLRHLLDNAHQHAGRDPVHVRVDSQKTPDGWEIAVEDDGQGIPPRDHERIFEPFRPRDPDPSSQETHMGLTTVRRLVERLGGSIDVDSEPGAGARFTFKVPRRSVYVDPRRDEELEVE